MAPYVRIDYTRQKELKYLNTRASDIMGKSRKVSKVVSNGFVPGYRHAVEAVAESDCFGSSDRVDPEFASLQDSYGSSRQCYSYNPDDHNDSSVRVRLFSVPGMSFSERKNLEMKLVDELERVRRLQNVISSYNMDSMMCPPADVEGLHMRNISTLVGIKEFPSGRNESRSKVGAVSGRRNESVKHRFQQTGNLDALLKECGALLTGIMRQKQAQLFNSPVDVLKFNIPDYFDIIKRPMDLGTIKDKLRSKQYSNPLEFASDVRLTFNNAMTYNPKGNSVHILAQNLSKVFEVKWKPIEKKILVMADESTLSMADLMREPANVYVPPPKKQKLSFPETNVNQRDKHSMSDEEKQRLSSELDSLLEELPENIINFLKESSVNGNKVTEDEIEIDFDSLSDGTLFTLRRLLDNYLAEKKKKRNLKPELSKIEHMQNELLHQSNKDDPAEEEVDVVGNDPPPVSSSPAENDYRGVGGGCMSRSSSSNSGSSSSESQSSADENDGVESSVPEKGSRDIGVQQSDRDLLKGNAENRSLSNSTAEHSCRSVGENVPSERLVSPEKLYRAALLRGRFADIIVKAQENTIEKGNRPDPGKLKLEREELERRRNEEKARLQAEAKAAEEARRNAELEAAAEAKRKREVEREAARQALQQMEKTVDINEGSQFIEDLDILSSAPDEKQLQNLTAELDPEDHEIDLVGSFKFQGNSNPLEQLGLFMKNDDEDDEEVEAESIMETSNDPEEGEIH